MADIEDLGASKQGVHSRPVSASGAAVVGKQKRDVKPNTVSAGAQGELLVWRRDGEVAPLNNLRGFVDYEREPSKYRPVNERINDWEVILPHALEREGTEVTVQSARCMDCGTPTCCSEPYGCPLGNEVPRFNKLAYNGQWREALDVLLSTSNAPEWTSHVCPAPCEGACVAGLVDAPVTIKNIEQQIIERGWANGWIYPKPPSMQTGKKVAVIGSGPAGLCAADMLNRRGHSVTVYERADRVGGLLMYGIPAPKLDKKMLQRRIDLWAEEGVKFVTGANVGVDPAHDLRDMHKNNDAIVLTVGATKPRLLNIPGSDLKGIYPAMDFLAATTKTLLDDGNGRLRHWDGSYISARDKNVVVIGGGDTGNDCVGTSVRMRARNVVNLELLDKPPVERDETMPWPTFPKTFKLDYGGEEAAAVFGQDPRQFNTLTKEYLGDETGHVVGIRTVRIVWRDGKMQEIPNSERIIPADLVLLSLGFLGPEETMLKQLSLDADKRGNIKAEYGDFATNLPGVFAAGDCRRGQSLVVRAMREGREVAAAVDKYLATQAPAAL
ncbi:Glutamate synthase NADH [Hondaea fermentalgiana]|uniref:Glutamate synthase NADH n=1 Tax=Hondaea fermentalgiana TaxID=2315210 RepID=A0A2R5GJG1_9STRA|nr:Glutamate synthase NADH [Hondaea fermentalgiana]|eukprot:GBG31017.1 Glutamate synthase NADH [Hondaea fermentalgiana]